MPEELLTRSEVADRLGIHPKTVTAWADRGILPPDRRLPGRGDRQWKQSTIDRFLADWEAK